MKLINTISTLVLIALFTGACDEAGEASGDTNRLPDETMSDEFGEAGDDTTREVREVETEFGLVRYEVIDGEAVLDGDMLMGTPEEFEARLEMGHLTPRGVGINTGKWASMPVKYSFANSITSAMEDDIEVALNRLVTQSHAQISFKKCTGLCLGAHIKFKFDPGGGCRAHVGWAPVGKVHLDTYCDGQGVDEGGPAYNWEIGKLMHEVMHALGVYHEQSRCDRDEFVTINKDNIKEGKCHNFNKHCWNADDFGDYDFDSIMHYQLDAYSKNGLPTISPVNPPDPNPGQRQKLSTGDEATLIGMYGQKPGVDPSNEDITPLAVCDKLKCTHESQCADYCPAWSEAQCANYPNYGGKGCCECWL